MKFFGQIINKTGKTVASYMYGHPTKKDSVVFQPDEQSEVYPILDEELVERLLEYEIGKAKLFKIPRDHLYSIIIIIKIT